MKKWYSVELNKDKAEKFKVFLKLNRIYYEPSSCYNLIHFEIKADAYELKKVDDFLENI